MNKYLYITAGAATTAKAGCIIDCSSATVANVTTGITTIFLDTHDGTRVKFVADSGTAYNGGAQSNKFNIGSVTTTEHLAEGIKLGIDNDSNFSVSRVDSAVSVTVSTVALNSNNNNFLTDDPEKESGIAVPNMTVEYRTRLLLAFTEQPVLLLTTICNLSITNLKPPEMGVF